MLLDFLFPLKLVLSAIFPPLISNLIDKAFALKPIGSSLCRRQFKQSWESVLSLWRERAYPLLSKGEETNVVRQRTT